MKNNDNTLPLLVGGALAIVVAAGLIIISVTAANDNAAVARCGILTGFFSLALIGLATLVKNTRVEQKVDAILNGKGQAKIEQGMRNVLAENGMNSDTPSSTPVPPAG